MFFSGKYFRYASFSWFATVEILLSVDSLELSTKSHLLDSTTEEKVCKSFCVIGLKTLFQALPSQTTPTPRKRN